MDVPGNFGSLSYWLTAPSFLSVDTLTFFRGNRAFSWEKLWGGCECAVVRLTWWPPHQLLMASAGSAPCQMTTKVHTQKQACPWHYGALMRGLYITHFKAVTQADKLLTVASNFSEDSSDTDGDVPRDRLPSCVVTALLLTNESRQK